MSTSLSMAFRQQVKQTKDLYIIDKMTYYVPYGTGFLQLNFVNGYMQEINNVKNMS